MTSSFTSRAAVATLSVLGMTLFALLSTAPYAFADDGGGSTLGNGPIAGTVIYMPENIYTGSGLIPLGNGGAAGASGVGLGGATCAPYIQSFNSIGDRGESVIALQRFLNQYEGAGLPLTGYFGTRTESAVKHFQARYDIRPTGRQRILTTTKINELVCQFGGHGVGKPPVQKSTALCPAYLAMTTTPTVHSAEVAKLQLFLNVYVNAKIPLTGFYGPQTKDAVLFFETGHKLPSPDGRIDVDTVKKINDLYCAYGGKTVTAVPKIVSVRQVVITPVSAAVPTVSVTQNTVASDTPSQTAGVVLGDAVENTAPTPAPFKRPAVIVGILAALLAAGFAFRKTA